MTSERSQIRNLSLGRCSSRERGYIALEMVQGKCVKVSRDEGPVARQPRSNLPYQLFNIVLAEPRGHPSIRFAESRVAFDSFFFVRSALY